MWDTGIIHWLQQFRSPFLDQWFVAFTSLGTELAYILLIPVVYWGIDRYKGHRLAVIFLLSIWLNGVVKEWMAMPRPEPGVGGILRLAEAAGAGFPSGHAQGSMTLWGWLAIEFPRPWVIALAGLMVVMISLSRLYLGVHFLGDVLGGWALGLLVIAAGAVIFARQPGERWGRGWKMGLAVAVPLLLFPLSPSGTSERALGFLIGLLTADMVALPGIPYGERASAVQHVARSLVGLAGLVGMALLIQRVVPPGLPAVLAYAVAAVWVAVLAPLLFLRTGLASPPRELSERARQRRIPSIASSSRVPVGPYLGIAAVAAVLVAAASAAAPSPLPLTEASRSLWATSAGPLNIAHRGGAGLAPENTLAAFQEGLRWGASYLELDVRPTRDGEVVVLHDERVDRTTDGTGEIASMDLGQAEALDAGYRFSPDGASFPYRGKGVRIPRLEDVLRAFPEARFVVEIKPDDPGFAARVLQAIDAAGARGRVVVASFSDRVLEQVRRDAPGVLTSTGAGEALRMVIMVRLGLGGFWTPPGQVVQVPERQGILPVVTESLIRVLHRRGVPVHVWTVDDVASMRRLAALGVDGIITDYPDRMASVLSTRAESHGHD